MVHQRYSVLILVLVVSYLFAVCSIVDVASNPLGESRTRAKHMAKHSTSNSHLYRKENENNEGGLFSLSALFRKYLPVIPNTYYDIPKHRYPYYDENGTGRLLYGYGGEKLYKYTVFKPLEGYF